MHLKPSSRSRAGTAPLHCGVRGGPQRQEAAAPASGAKQYKLHGQQLQRGLLISLIVVLLVCGI
ncbi:hypothetical protein WJX81_005638 [Elliptochloris bilobata]|uniref:Uncharacterized protein n=1 Tax=Elliptochloris bilobata TaxID=381761 RepID=A0AAW1R162_9CHLO